ncbi:MAG: AMP-binding protein [Deltaproteobacteria bacterium]|nr:AMP-binding protein [Deltaproteobacteria bacterium]
MNAPVTSQYRDTPPRHLGGVFFDRVGRLGERTFIRLQRGDRCDEISWRDFGSKVQSVLLALRALGLAPGSAVAIIGENSIEWLCADLATLAGGFPNVVISPALSDAMLLKMLGHSRCRAAFVQGAAGAGRLLNLKGQLPALQWIFVMGENDLVLPDALSFQQLIDRGRQSAAERLGEILQSVHPNDLATIMYTSGSTGAPKGVMRTHENLLSNITNGAELELSKPEELFVIVLNLNHLYGRFGFLKSVATGRTTAIVEATELALDLKLIESVGGTSMAVVPRVMARIWNLILDQADNRERWERLEKLDQRKSGGGLGDPEQREFDELRTALKEVVRKALGGRIKYISYGGAAMAPRIMRFFELIRIPLIGSYGSTECGGVTLCGLGENRPGSLGKPFPNVEVRIAGDGELLVRGPTVTPGYFQDQAATREVLDADGWFHTGDLGAIDPDGSLRIVGRKKDVFYCSDGSNIYPGHIEMLLENDPLVRQAILVGDHRPFIAALLVPERKKIAAELTKQESRLTDDDIAAVLYTRLAQINSRLEEVERVRKMVVMQDEFPAEVRSVSAFQKIKIDRKAVEERYQKEISSIYLPAVKGERG